MYYPGAVLAESLLGTGPWNVSIGNVVAVNSVRCVSPGYENEIKLINQLIKLARPQPLG